MMEQLTILDYLVSQIDVYYAILANPDTTISTDFVIELDALEKCYDDWQEPLKYGYIN